MQTFHLAIGLRKNEPRLMEWVNGWVKANLKNGKLNDIYKSYHGVGVAADILKAGD
jgi:polar amino acid transport system substrate-binding protein